MQSLNHPHLRAKKAAWPSLSGARGVVRMTPHSTSETAPSRARATTPYPVTAVPGSTPSTSASTSGIRSDLGEVDVQVSVRIDLLDVVHVLQQVEQLG